MAVKDTLLSRFGELSTQSVRYRNVEGIEFAENQDWANWSSSALNLIQITFGADSPHFARLRLIIEQSNSGAYPENVREARGVFLAAKTDYEKGCCQSLERQVSGEVFGDFTAAAKRALDEGYKDVAAVLACAALEDALKKFANANGLAVDGKDMSEVIGALKSKGLVGGSLKSILETMPKTRNAAMHADWSKITPTEVGGVIGFTEQFLLQNFS